MRDKITAISVFCLVAVVVAGAAFQSRAYDDPVGRCYCGADRELPPELLMNFIASMTYYDCEDLAYEAMCFEIDDNGDSYQTWWWEAECSEGVGCDNGDDDPDVPDLPYDPPSWQGGGTFGCDYNYVDGMTGC